MKSVQQSSILPLHRERLALVYVRESASPHNTLTLTGFSRQLAQWKDALHLGWPSAQIEIIADDVGAGGSGEVNRPGYHRLLHLISEEKVGVVLVADLARITRSRTELQRFLSLCDQTGTLVAVQGSICGSDSEF